MLPARKGSFRLFRFSGIDVYLHWSWFVVAIFEIQNRKGLYGSLTWNAFEYLALFLIVLLHEFGHSLACRQVGGQAEQIILWPLGGVAFVAPPPRPGATLWSIAAGPLVNVVLAPLLIGGLVLANLLDWDTTSNAYQLFRNICYINIFILIFNLMPIYPLDGGQILRSLLWFWLGRARSLLVAAGIGFVGVAVMGVAAFFANSIWFGIMAVFILLNCWRGLVHAKFLARLAEAPRRQGYACPVCHQPPVMVPVWLCGQCRNKFDIFETRATCPSCGNRFNIAACVDCGAVRPFEEWLTDPSAFPPAPPIVGKTL